jgi:ATP-dependent Clp protease protease subunit
MIINLQGELIPDDWAEIYRYWGFNSGFYCPGDIRAAVAELSEGEELVLEINSIGGSVDGAAEIYSIIQKLGNPTKAEIQSLAASAASYFPLACDRVEISLPAQMMIHCSSVSVRGNKYDHSWAASQLETTDVSILDTYCRKCGDKADRDELKKMMDEETYLSAHECLRLGLVDAIIGEAQKEESPMGLVASVHDNTVRAMRTLPDIRELRTRRDEQLAALDQQLAEEKSRYTQ